MGITAEQRAEWERLEEAHGAAREAEREASKALDEYLVSIAPAKAGDLVTVYRNRYEGRTTKITTEAKVVSVSPGASWRSRSAGEPAYTYRVVYRLKNGTFGTATHDHETAVPVVTP